MPLNAEISFDEEPVPVLEAIQFGKQVRQLRESLKLTQLIKCFEQKDGIIVYVVDLPNIHRIHIANG